MSSRIRPARTGSAATRTLVGLSLLLALTGGISVFVPSPDPARAFAAEDGSKEVDVKEIKKLIKQSYMAQDLPSLRSLLLKLARMALREPVRAVLDSAQNFGKSDETEDWYWALLEGASAFNRPLAYSEIGDSIVQYRKKAISRDLLHGLHKNRTNSMGRIFRRVLESCPLDMKLMTVDMAAQVQVRRTVDILMEVYKREEEKPSSDALRQRLVLALEALTLEQMGDSYPNWIGWWQAQRHKGLKVIRDENEHREGATGVARPMDPIRERQFLGLEKMPEGKVLVVEGPIARNGVNTNNDDISAVLDRLKIPHDKVLKERLDERSYRIDQYAAILINCTQIHEFCQSPGHRGGEAVGNRLRRCLGPNPHDNVQFKIGPMAKDKLKAWVKAGGILFTEDWVLAEMVADNWPKYLSLGAKLNETHVDIRAARGQTTNPLLRGVFVPPPKLEDYDWDPGDPFEDEDDEEDEKEEYDPKVEDDEGDKDTDSGGRTGVDPEAEPAPEEQFEDPKIDSIAHEWKIDNESNAIDVRSRKVQVLITSKKLKSQAGKSNAVAVTFDYGAGKVLHVLSHFGKQNSAHNEATIENLLINYLLEVKVRVMGN